MPLPVIFNSRGSCVYQQCEQGGHTVCRSFGAYYTALCEAAQAVVDSPTGENLATLQEMLKDQRGLE